MSEATRGPVLVTGGTGSFGSTMVRRLLATASPRSASSAATRPSRTTCAGGSTTTGCVLSRRRPRPRQRARTPSAASTSSSTPPRSSRCRQCEFFPLQAVHDERPGQRQRDRGCRARRGRSVVCLSTDKAVYPVNAMGMSKALMEKVAQAFARNNPGSSDHGVSIMRYGNVMYSRGSVIPLFVEQLTDGPPLDRHRSGDDPVPDVARRVRRPGRARLRPRRARRPVRPQGAAPARSRTWRAPSPTCSASTTRRSSASAPGTARRCTRRCSAARS